MQSFTLFPAHSSWLDMASASGSSYLLVFAAEIGDKSQLVCMALAAKYRATPVILGAALAFIVLNSLAVLFGVAIASWIPQSVMTAIVALLFAVFGIQALRNSEDEEVESIERSNRNVLVTTFLLITLAEFGDKTQLAVVALSATYIPLAVWIGATLALISTSSLGVWAGRTLLQKIPMDLIHRFSGVLFLLLAMFAGWETYQLLNL
ncbi:TMEM165/GDT1 family protein [Neptunicella sp.]|uniref:TMEM165/GDT1 family protein n=1 Tax=Neptunicella sp. TaxID=2125986 RepID=UPI003F693D7A